MDLDALGQACDAFCALPDDRARAQHPFGKWLTSYRHDGMFPLTLYVTRYEDGYMSHGRMGTINWIADDEVFVGYPSERPGGARNYRYEVPADAYLPIVHRDS